MSFQLGVCLKTWKGLRLIPIIFLLAGCCNLFPVSKSKKLDSVSWSLPHICQWFSEKKAGLKQITAWAKVGINTEGGQKALEVFLSLDHKGAGRLEGLGPWKAPIFYLLFDPDSLYFYLPGESRLYLGNNRPDHVQKLIGLPLDLSLLFDLISSNLPEGLSECPHELSQKEKGAPPVLYLCWEGQGIPCDARVVLKEFPVVEEMTCRGEQMHESLRVRYCDMVDFDGYDFPEKIYLYCFDGSEWYIRFKSVKVNQMSSKTIFNPDESWFKGEVVVLDD